MFLILTFQEQDPTESPKVSTTPVPIASRTTLWVTVGVTIFFLAVLGALIFILRQRIVKHIKMMVSLGIGAFLVSQQFLDSPGDTGAGEIVLKIQILTINFI